MKSQKATSRQEAQIFKVHKLKFFFLFRSWIQHQKQPIKSPLLLLKGQYMKKFLKSHIMQCCFTSYSRSKYHINSKLLITFTAQKHSRRNFNCYQMNRLLPIWVSFLPPFMASGRKRMWCINKIHVIQQHDKTQLKCYRQFTYWTLLVPLQYLK